MTGLARVRVYVRGERTPASERWLRVQDFAGSAIAMRLAIFARIYFDAVRKWLLILGIVVAGASLTLELLPTPRLVLLELTRVTQIPTFNGATDAFAQGVRKP